MRELSPPDVCKNLSKAKLDSADFASRNEDLNSELYTFIVEFDLSELSNKFSKDFCERSEVSQACSIGLWSRRGTWVCESKEVAVVLPVV